MGLSSLQLDAFFAAARALNFSQAAETLHITQSALSQRIKALESDLSLTLFTRLPRGVQLTEAGARLLRYCQARSSMEEELVEQLTSKESGLGGSLRIAGYSSIVRSVLLPALAPLLRDNPNVQAHIQNAEIRELPELLLTGNVDLIVTDTPIQRADIETIELGHEEYVMCQSAKAAGSDQRYLDHDPSDTTTHRFFMAQGRVVPEYQRAFLDETYAIIDGVAAGLGKAVLSRHLIARDKRIEVLKYKSMRTNVVMQHHKQPHYTGLQRAALTALASKCPGLLETRD
ncbi:MAG: LysR family transcriptional regulator [Deltaproteobacteria bacterium]|nr:LysR family transcriptional regulator [Deltaproteobacteria bacterium]